MKKSGIRRNVVKKVENALEERNRVKKKRRGVFYSVFSWFGRTAYAKKEKQVIGRFHLGREDYGKYSRLCRMIQRLVNKLKQIDPKDPFRIEMTDRLSEKL